ncbi:MAG TPA: PIN domain-containing protein [Candidatus Dormibacteraeota bacterium]|nr:PIN domain-containing protein [Candidatus Dormibacteraeota bacterium]
MALTALDSSVLIPAVAPWHAEHERVDRVLGRLGELVMIGHVLLETYAFLTRNRPRTPPKAAAELLRAMPGPVVVLSVEGKRQLLDRVGAAGLTGGAVYDALIGATALEAGARLLSRDERAARTYASIGVPFDLI